MQFNKRVITDQEEFRGMKDEWNILLSKSRTNTIFLTWEWLYTWWEVFGKGGKLFIIAVKDGSGNLVGLAPLFVRKTRYYSMPVKEMCFIGTGLSDRQDFLIVDGNIRILHEIVSTICWHEREWDIVQLDQIPEENLFASEDFDAALRAEHEDSSLCPYVRIRGDWDPYYKGLGKKFNRDMKHKQNRLSRFGYWEFRTEPAPPHGIDTLIETLAKTEEQSRKQGAKPFFSIRKNREFLIKFSHLCIPKGWFDFSTITVHDVPIAYLIGFRYNSKYYAYNMAFLEEYYAASPGKLLINEKLKWCFESSGAIMEFDFLRGDTYIKALWASAARQHSRLVLFDNSLYTRLIRLAVFRVRPMLKKLMKKQKGNEMPAVSETKG
jgi:CelD/BcsL family acetyltransferase involved in cellulose biosynthesis